jgi:ketosteroid isomerase-like protein
MLCAGVGESESVARLFDSHQEELTMSAREEVQRLTEQIATASAKGDFAPFVNALDDDLEVFDHAPFLFDSKAAFVDYLQGSTAASQSTTFAFHQPSVRAVNDSTAVVNSYDRMAIVPKGGGVPRTLSGRTTLVMVKRGSQWKIVSAHFSPLPAA